MIKKADRKERLVKIYRMLMVTSADKSKLKEIRKELATYIGEDVGVFLVEKND